MMRNMAGMMKKVQEMQERMEALQVEMAATEFTASVGGGSVSVTVSGKGEVRDVTIDPDAVDKEDMSISEDMIQLAANNARAEADPTMAAKMKDITGGLPLPPGMSLPFDAGATMDLQLDNLIRRLARLPGLARGRRAARCFTFFRTVSG